MNYQPEQKENMLFLNQIKISLILILAFNQAISSQTQLSSNNNELIKQALTEFVNDGKAPGMIATLVSEGKLSWDMNLLEAIPELEPEISEDYHYITLWQLLTHCAGLPKNPSNWAAFPGKEITQRRLAILEENLERPATYKPGEFHYSNFGYMIAACMAEKVTGLSWETLMRQRLFVPLGMTTAGYGEPDRNQLIDQPWGHQKIFGKWRPSRSYYPEAIGPAGEVHCSVEDWAKFVSLQLSSSNPILDSTYLKKLIVPDVGFYAGGWGVAEHDWARGITLSHNGSNEIWYTSVLVVPGLRRAYLVATNSCDFGVTVDICSEITNELIRRDL